MNVISILKPTGYVLIGACVLFTSIACTQTSTKEIVPPALNKVEPKANAVDQQTKSSNPAANAVDQQTKPSNPIEDNIFNYINDYFNLLNEGKIDEAEKLVSIPGGMELNKIFGKITNIDWVMPEDKDVLADIQCPKGHVSDRTSCFVYALTGKVKNDFMRFSYKAKSANGCVVNIIGFYHAIDASKKEFKVDRLEIAVTKAANSEKFAAFVDALKAQTFLNENK